MRSNVGVWRGKHTAAADIEEPDEQVFVVCNIRVGGGDSFRALDDVNQGTETNAKCIEVLILSYL